MEFCGFVFGWEGSYWFYFGAGGGFLVSEVLDWYFRRRNREHAET